MTVPKGYSVPDLLRQLAPAELVQCFDFLAALVGTFRNTAAQPPVVKELLKEIELRYQNQKEEELHAQRLSFIDKHEQSSILWHKQNDIDTADLRHELDLKIQEIKTLVENHKMEIETLKNTHEQDHTLAHKQAELCRSEATITNADLRHELDMKNQKDAQHAHQVETLAAQHAHQVENLKQQIEVQYTQQVENHKQQIEILKNTYEQQITQRLLDVQAFHKQQIAEKSNQIELLNTQINKVHTNTSQGQEGEVQVAELVKGAMQSSIVSWEDMTRVEGAGDARARISRHDEEYDFLIEAKNVKDLHSKRDIEKFHTDIVNQKPDCAIMISLCENSVRHGASTYKREFIAGIPALTIQTTCEHTVKLCIEFLIVQVRSKREILQLKDVSHYSANMDNLFTQVLDHELSLKGKSEIIEDLRKDLDRDRKRVDEMKACIKKFITMYPRHAAKSTMDLAIEEVKPDLTKKSDYTSNEQLELFNKAGGWSEVRAEAKRRKIIK